MAPNRSKKSTLRSVINEVTKEKLQWLENQKVTLKNHFTPVLEKYEKPENRKSIKFLREIQETLVSARDDNPVKSKTNDLAVFLNWLKEKEETDNAAIYFGSERLVENWIETLIKDIKFRIEKCEYSCLYANVMSQYMASNETDTADIDDDDVDKKEDKESIPATKEETKQEFSRLVLSEPENFNKERFDYFLETKLFNLSDPLQKDKLHQIRRDVESFCKSFDVSRTWLTVSTIKTCLDGLLKDSLIDNDRKKTLKELRENSAALEEVCSLLNKRILNYTKWHWPEPVFVDFRRNMAGRYRAYHDEDILTSIILHYLGAMWSIKLKGVFKSIYESSVWKRGTEGVGNRYYQSSSIEGYRRDFHRSSFLAILPDSLEGLAGSGVGYDDDDYDHSRSRRSQCRRPVNTTDKLSPFEYKKKMVHLISSEIHLNNVLRHDSPLVVVQTDVEWFGPSMVHDAILAVMKFFGVTDEWLQFFKRFLQTPMRIGSPKAPPVFRKRGAPISHTFTSLFGETLLFIMDLYVNRESGLNIYRLHDDFWFWGYNEEAVKKAWVAMQTFTKLADLKLNQEKSASAICSIDANPEETTFGPEPLPQKVVKWGFVILHSDGEFRISKELLDPHVKEMKEYLDASDTVMNWIYGHNKYVRFFIRNFLEPVKVLGLQHVVQIIESLNLILKTIHPEANGDVVVALKRRFNNIFGAKDAIDSWFHWPVKEGGLGLYNPFMDLIPLHDDYRKQETSNWFRFEGAVYDDKMEWSKLVKASRERRRNWNDPYPHPSFKTNVEEEDDTVTDSEIFGGDYYSSYNEEEKAKRRKKIVKRVDFKTWCERTREYRSHRWRSTYEGLLQKVGDPATGNHWRTWLYEGQLHSKLGPDEDEFVDDNLVPLSLISSMQESRVHKN